MNFVQIEFLWFMGLMFLAYWGAGSLPKGRILQNLILAVGSAIFYGWVHPWFLLLLYFSAVLDFNVGKAMVRFPAYRAYLLLMSLAGNLGVLAYFKYFNFFVQNVIDALTLMGVESDLRTLAIVLPVGVSFYTFQTLSYTIDIYRGELQPRKNFLDYVVYVTFFPQLVAGPIERAGHLLPQVEKPRQFDIERTLSGITLAMWGGFKKMCVADTIAPYVDKVFILDEPSGPLIWAAAIGFSIQIFADFSAYTDIARGCARVLGFELIENFKSPYLAATTPEFWQRWHISLSFWIRDYIMVPLLGTASKLSMGRFLWATMVTFTVIGFWHGASWNFILFGVWHGFWMSFYTIAVRHRPEWMKRMPLGRPIAVAINFTVVSIPGSMLFRETHVDRLIMHLSKNPFAATADEWMATSVVLGMTAVVAVPLMLAWLAERAVIPRLQESVWLLPARTTTWAVLGCMMFVFYRVSAYDFVYFQF